MQRSLLVALMLFAPAASAVEYLEYGDWVTAISDNHHLTSAVVEDGDGSVFGYFCENGECRAFVMFPETCTVGEQTIVQVISRDVILDTPVQCGTFGESKQYYFADQAAVDAAVKEVDGVTLLHKKEGSTANRSITYLSLKGMHEALAAAKQHLK
jgi:hypothetical protein